MGISNQLPARACITGAWDWLSEGRGHSSQVFQAEGDELEVLWRSSPYGLSRCSESVAGKQLLNLMAHQILPGALCTDPAGPAGHLLSYLALVSPHI